MVTDDVFAVIAEATRRDILVSLRSGDKAVGELVEELDASQPTISKHLKVLREADLVSMRAQGQKRYYALNPKPLAGVASWLETFDVGPRAAAVSSPAAQVLEEKTVQAAETAAAAPVPAATGPGRPAAAAVPGASEGGQLSPAVAIPVATAGDDTVPQQIGRTVGRAATKAADLIANLPKFGRKK
ncbi:DNA-binding transcriptional ArsR family regulator [Arthrobacter sp. PvP102]|jgi:DNA-binding transcriptional ArsR family regulator|uniref:ArsR/SmtB family transcription factor n=1 Tax=unclassified Arthrobacter TaxID=235627 RepID=UPI001AE3FCE3|nr:MULTISPECIES: metalloregulator ArsR/SmtB family transcription factor [unclassified Arthrobacter]MBP1232686.1 DNA-binding transcriptional ArsR family regulator [Arthrobacter sp. PvP103]MBP1237821.1 DNA-binding transcriptional ArsR family regulator [Arthrobacter sp. PvP102]